MNEMNDHISRQAAFNTVTEYRNQLREIFGDENELIRVVDIVKHRLIALPSTQPEVDKDTNVLINDCISRQAMFDTAAEYEKQLREILGDENELVEVVKILKHRLIALPSAQPEQTRVFVGLVVEYPDPELCTYKEYKGKPYYSIKYIENGETYVGYGTYNPEVLSQYLKEYFISSAQPDLSSYSDKLWRNAYERGKAEAQAEIIRCGECKFYTAYDYTGKLMCNRIGKGMILPKPEDYCSYAERITDGTEQP